VDSPSHTVLVVDDDSAIRFLCRVNLELDGWRVVEAATIPQAREAIDDGDVGIVLLDVHVGSGNGVEFLGELGELQTLAAVGAFDQRLRVPAGGDGESDARRGQPIRLRGALPFNSVDELIDRGGASPQPSA
jgi:DNA-binding NarL/FixJ family response regulator